MAAKHGNAWKGALTGKNGVSEIIDVAIASNVSVFGHTSAATTITVEYSQDRTQFYNSETTISASGNFGKSIAGVGARYIRLRSSADVIATVTVAGKT